MLRLIGSVRLAGVHEQVEHAGLAPAPAQRPGREVRAQQLASTRWRDDRVRLQPLPGVQAVDVGTETGDDEEHRQQDGADAVRRFAQVLGELDGGVARQDEANRTAPRCRGCRSTVSGGTTGSYGRQDHQQVAALPAEVTGQAGRGRSRAPKRSERHGHRPAEPPNSPSPGPRWAIALAMAGLPAVDEMVRNAGSAQSPATSADALRGAERAVRVVLGSRRLAVAPSPFPLRNGVNR